MKVSILDVEITCFNKKVILNHDFGPMMQVITINSEILTYARKNINYKNIINRNVATIDSELLIKYLRFVYKNLNIEKISGSDLIYDIFTDCMLNNKKVFLLGAAKKSNLHAQKIIKAEYNINVDGCSPKINSLPIDDQNYYSLFDKIKLFKPHYLLVALGPPKQENFINYYKRDLEKLGIKVAVGIGGSIDFVSGQQTRAPIIIQKFVLEWLYRLIMDPRRIKRIINIFPVFYYLFVDYYNKSLK